VRAARSLALAAPFEILAPLHGPPEAGPVLCVAAGGVCALPRQCRRTLLSAHHAE